MLPTPLINRTHTHSHTRPHTTQTTHSAQTQYVAPGLRGSYLMRAGREYASVAR